MIFKKLPEGFVPMNEGEFARAYIQAKQTAGDSFSTLEVVRSWHNYQADPVGHFLSKPTNVLDGEDNHEHAQAQSGV